MSTLNSILYERNLLYQQFSFKWNSYLYLRKLLGLLHSRKTTGIITKTLFTTVFLVAYLIDFILGALLLIIMHTYPLLRVSLKEYISLYTLSMLHWTKELIVWLMGIPAGLKLNTPLDHFLGHRFLSILELWEYFYSDFIATSLSIILPVILLLACVGLTISLTALHDFLKFLNLCLISFFIFASRIVSLQVSALKSLARLFMGKKWNILRKRVDSCNYDTSQLLVGTIIFTMLLFLLPTTGMYFIIFFLMKVLQFGLQLVLRTHTVLVNRLTVWMWRRLEILMTDRPLTKLKMNVEVPPEAFEFSDKGVIGEIGNSYQDAHLSICWNGQNYSASEICDVIEKVSVTDLLKELDCNRVKYANKELNHDMLSFIGTLQL